ncbi:MAG: hypothetical protein ABI723_08810, partial [Bacteroidia bacterium]
MKPNLQFSIALAILVISISNLFAQLPVVATHPRLYLTPAIKTQLLNKKFANAPEWVTLLAQANNYSVRPVLTWDQASQYTWNNAFIFYSYNGSSWDLATMTLAMAHQLTKTNNPGANPTVYSNKLIQLVDTIFAAQFSPLNTCAGCKVPIETNNYYSSRHLGRTLGVIFDWCYDELDATHKNEIITVMNAWYDDMRTQWHAYQNDDRATGNYYWGHAMCAAFMGYASAGDNVRANEMIAYARARFDGTASPLLIGPAQFPLNWLTQTFNGGYKPYVSTAWQGLNITANVQKGGMQIQGWAYGGENWARILDYMLIVKSATTEDLITAHNYMLVDLLRATYHSLLPQRYEIDHCGDWGGNMANYIMLNAPLRLASMLSGYPYGPQAQYFYYNYLTPHQLWGNTVWDPDAWEKMLFLDNTRPNAPFNEHLHYSGFADGYNLTGGNGAYPLFLMRNNWNTSATWANYHAGCSQYDDHQHFDAGALEIKNGDDYLILDASCWHGGLPNGLTGNSCYAQSSSHCNTLWFNDFGDYNSWIDARHVGGQYVYGHDEIQAAQNDDTLTYIRSDLTTAYHRNGNQTDISNRKLNYFRRDFLYLRASNIFLTRDQVDAKNSANINGQYQKHIRWHFPVNAPTVNGNMIHSFYGTSELYIHTLIPAAPQINIYNENSNSDNTFGAATNYYFNSQTYRAEVSYAANPLRQTYLSVLQPLNTGGAQMTTTQLNSNDGKMEGATIIATASNDLVLFNKDTTRLQSPVTTTNYNFTGDCHTLHTLAGMIPNGHYNVTYNGSMVTVTQNGTGTYIASAEGVMQFKVWMPAVIAGTINGNNNVPISSQNYNVTNTAGQSYTWSLSGGGTITPAGNTANINWTTSGTYTIIVTPTDFCGAGIADTIIVTVLPNPLGVQLIDFGGNFNPATNTNNLYWLTLSETENDHFDIEKSLDAKNFYVIGEVPGTGTSNQLQHYRFDDSDPFTGENYYRLHQFDRNGKATYSQTIIISS